MTVLIELKEKLKEFYGSCSGIVLPIVKFLLALAVFRGINSNLGYLKMLNSMYVVLILSLICAILPLNGMVFLAMLVIIGHCFAPDRKSTRLNSSHSGQSRMPSSA